MEAPQARAAAARTAQVDEEALAACACDSPNPRVRFDLTHLEADLPPQCRSMTVLADPSPAATAAGGATQCCLELQGCSAASAWCRTPLVCSLTVPEDYPWTPPTVRFEGRQFHPNICAVSGRVRLCDLLQGAKWSPTASLLDLVHSLARVLDDPFVDQDSCNDAAMLFKEGPDLYWAELRRRLGDP